MGGNGESVFVRHPGSNPGRLRGRQTSRYDGIGQYYYCLSSGNTGGGGNVGGLRRVAPIFDRGKYEDKEEEEEEERLFLFCTA
jgi:hypothetical protein